MNYFVSINDCYYHEWQIKILLDSFKKLKLEDKLFISVASNKKNRNYKKDNFYFFKNVGSQKEYLKYNKWYSLYILLKTEIIKQPITVLEPHMVMIKPLDLETSANITYQFSNEFIYDDKYLIKEVNPYNKEFMQKYWCNLGDTIVFNNLSEDFFINILSKIEKYSLYLEDYNNLDKIALSNSIWDYASTNKAIRLESKINLECQLNQNNLEYILNYRHGFKNIFNKKFYKNKRMFMSDKDLKTNISSIRYTKCLDFFYNNIN
jgi:hypothetical protein